MSKKSRSKQNAARRMVQQARRISRKRNPDFEAAFELLTRAYALGSPEAGYAIGTWYLHGRFVGRNLALAIKHLRYSADENYPAACFDLAICYERGVGVKKSEKQAAIYYLRGALLGDVQSVYEIGRCYYHGVGVARDRKIANEWLGRAEQLGWK